MNLPHDAKMIEHLHGYAVTPDGCVWSDVSYSGWGPFRKNTRTGLWRKIPLLTKRSDYKRVGVSGQLFEDKKSRTFLVHRLVLEAFVGKCPIGKECLHVNGDKHDNRIENLRWGTHIENTKDKRIHGTHSYGESHHSAKLSNDDVVEIKRLLSENVKGAEIARIMGISPQHVCSIKKNRRRILA